VISEAIVVLVELVPLHYSITLVQSMAIIVHKEGIFFIKSE
jgi:hypothetical protein